MRWVKVALQTAYPKNLKWSETKTLTKYITVTENSNSYWGTQTGSGNVTGTDTTTLTINKLEYDSSNNKIYVYFETKNTSSVIDKKSTINGSNSPLIVDATETLNLNIALYVNVAACGRVYVPHYNDGGYGCGYGSVYVPITHTLKLTDYFEFGTKFHAATTSSTISDYTAYIYDGAFKKIKEAHIADASGSLKGVV